MKPGELNDSHDVYLIDNNTLVFFITKLYKNIQSMISAGILSLVHFDYVFTGIFIHVIMFRTCSYFHGKSICVSPSIYFYRTMKELDKAIRQIQIIYMDVAPQYNIKRVSMEGNSFGFCFKICHIF